MAPGEVKSFGFVKSSQIRICQISNLKFASGAVEISRMEADEPVGQGVE